MLDERLTAALEAATWLAADRKREPRVLAAVLELQLPDPYAAAQRIAEGSVDASGQIVLLAELLKRPFSGDPQLLLDTIDLVGARAWALDPENIDEWIVVARRYPTTVTAGSGYAYAARQHLHGSTTEGIDAFLAAGRGPVYANAIVEISTRVHVAPSAFGYGPQITPATFEALAVAGLSARHELDAYCETGLSLSEAIEFAAAGISFDATQWALGTGVPREQWRDVLTGIPAGWLPRMHTLGYSVDDMRFLAEHGWGERFGPTRAHSGFRYASRSYATITVAQALRLAPLVTPDGLETWLTQLTTGKGGTTITDAALPPLVRWIGKCVSDELIAQIEQLLALGVRPSHLGTFRNAGCRSVDDIVAVIGAGIPAARAKALVEQFGTQVTYRPRRFPDVRALVQAHRDHPAGD